MIKIDPAVQIHEITVKRLVENAVLPSYATGGSACFDLFATAIQPQKEENTRSVTFHTGLAFDIPDGFVMRVYSRSGHGFNKGIRLANCVGIIDSDYTGEVMVKLVADIDCPTGEKTIEKLVEMANAVKDGEKVAVAQAEIVPVHYFDFVDGEIEKQTERGAKGFGSTDGKKSADYFDEAVKQGQ